MPGLRVDALEGQPLVLRGSDFAAPDFDGCGRVWNTFDTGGECPGCHHVWEWTACLWCHEWSRHADWYVDEDEPT